LLSTPRLSSTTNTDQHQQSLLRSLAISTSITVPFHPNQCYSCLLYLPSASSNGNYSISHRSNAMDPEDIIQFTRGLRRQGSQEEVPMNRDRCSMVKGEEYEMQEKEATSGLVGHLALLRAAQEVSANVPRYPAADTDSYLGNQES
jgi:hypothetical protein